MVGDAMPLSPWSRGDVFGINNPPREMHRDHSSPFSHASDTRFYRHIILSGICHPIQSDTPLPKNRENLSLFDNYKTEDYKNASPLSE